jgi:AcrR family transcriptional regulator
MGTGGERLRDPRRQVERATRILDVAADLLLRHGYRRVTIDDVAAAAGVGKGTVYLHWKTREQLFSAVFEREVIYAIDALRQAVLQDPLACQLHRFARTYFLAIMNRPLLRGLILADPELLGRLTTSLDTARDDRHRAMAGSYVKLLAAHRLLRDDMNIDEIVYAYQATFEGFLQTERDRPADGLDHRADLLARTVQRAFESDLASPDTTLRDLATEVITLLTHLIDADHAESRPPDA